MDREVTVVTAFFDIGRASWRGDVDGVSVPDGLARSNETYLGWFRHLSLLKNELIIFTQPTLADPILEARRHAGLDGDTTIFVCDDLFSLRGVARMVSLINSAMGPELRSFVDHPGHPEYWNPAYVTLNLLKPTFVCEAIRRQANRHAQLAWIDFGYCRDAVRFDRRSPWTFDTQGRMNLFYIRRPDDRPIFDVVRTGDVYFQGCHMVGPAESWPPFRALMEQSALSLLSCGLADDDQTVLLMAYRRAPEEFHIHAVDPSDWFVLFRKFGANS